MITMYILRRLFAGRMTDRHSSRLTSSSVVSPTSTTVTWKWRQILLQTSSTSTTTLISTDGLAAGLAAQLAVGLAGRRTYMRASSVYVSSCSMSLLHDQVCRSTDFEFIWKNRFCAFPALWKGPGGVRSLTRITFVVLLYGVWRLAT